MCKILIIIIVLINSLAFASPKKISLKEAIKIALKNNLEYKISLKEQGIADEKVNAVWGKLMPVLESEISMIRQYAENGFLSLSDGQYDIKVIQLTFGINPGMFYNSLKMSKKAYKAAALNVRRIKSEIIYNVIKSYFSVLLADELISLREDAISLLKENLKDVNNLYKTGTVPKYELLQAQVKLKSQEPLLFEARNKYSLSLDLYNYYLGNDTTKYGVNIDILKKTKFRKPRDKTLTAIKRLSPIAMRNRPEIIQLTLKKEIAGHLKNINSSFYIWPTFTIGGYYGVTKLLPNTPNVNAPVDIDLSGITGNSNWQNTFQVRLAATYRWSALLPVDSSRANERQEKINIKKTELELNRLKRLISISLKSNYSKLMTSYYTINSQRENVDRAQEGLRIARVSYNAGVIKNSELLASQLSLTEAKTGYINAINNYYQSLASLQKEIGIDNENIIFGGKDE
ncbi:TolC family protein [Spirochaetota bacterium]